MHDTYPEGQSLRYRSSTNNEDLPGFSGAGLYDSKTQDPDETEEDGIDKSIKAVWASLWNFRAFIERDLHGIDHLSTAMGVLVHPNYKGELANGVAVSFDPLYGTQGSYYVNTQLGEDLVTNPDAHSVPEEILLEQSGSYTSIATSNRAGQGQFLMNDAQMVQLRGHLEAIHAHFEGLYNPGPGEPFAMEIEFKITSDDVLAIKQARPWVFSRPNTQGPETVRTSTLTVEARSAYAGYSSFARPVVGALSETDFEVGGETRLVKYLLLHEGGVQLGLDESFDAGFLLKLGDYELASKEATAGRNASVYWFKWEETRACAGQTATRWR